jgi:transcriptional regulator with XRE-family HTH domain
MRHPRGVARPTISTWQPDRLRTLLHERGWTSGELAKVLDCPRSRIDGWLYNGTPSPGGLRDVAAALKVPTTDLAPLSDTPTLHELRWHAGLTASDLAEAVGLSVSRVSAQLRGESAITRHDQWVEALGVSREALDAAWASARRPLSAD